MINLPTITVVAVTGKDYGTTIEALLKTLNVITPAKVLYFSDVPYFGDPRITHIQIDPLRNVEAYNHFIFKRLGDYVDTGHILVVQHDGYPIDATAWDDEFLRYDYMGAPWTYTDGRNVGNGGFSLRSAKLHKVLQYDCFEYYSPEDEKIARYYRQTLEKTYGIKFAPDSVAHRFSFEMHRPTQKTFGFHNYFHAPYKEPVILKRSGAMGDIIMLEPVMAWFVDKGYRVILDTQRQYFNLFLKHYYQVEHVQDLYDKEPLHEYRTINLDMAYEVDPKVPVLESYYRTCGITDGPIRNSRLNFRVPEDKKDMKIFDKYVILHTDDTDMSHRNVHGVDWDEVSAFIHVFLGYPVFRVGRGNGQGGQKINTFSENMLAYIVGNADYFIGLDSGCAQIAAGCEVPSMIFFGSVTPNRRYQEFNKIRIMQKACPAKHDGCYHDVVSVRGQDCQVDTVSPPCITWKTKEVMDAIKNFIV